MPIFIPMSKYGQIRHIFIEDNTPKTFTVGDRVRIATTSEYYGQGSPMNPIDVGGVVTKVLDRSDTLYFHNITVLWDNEAHNSYRVGDLTGTPFPMTERQG